LGSGGGSLDYGIRGLVISGRGLDYGDGSLEIVFTALVSDGDSLERSFSSLEINFTSLDTWYSGLFESVQGSVQRTVSAMKVDYG
jgi:hypothetical protein